MRLTRVNERRNNRGSGSILLIAVAATVVIVVIFLVYWLVIRTTEESSPSLTSDTNTAQLVVPTVVPTVLPTISVPATKAPTTVPTAVPTLVPTLVPTPVPTMIPTAVPAPTPVPTPALPLPAIVNDNPPHVFVGTVTIGGQPAPEGTEVTAWVLKYSDPVGTSIVPSVASNPGSYSLLVPQHGNDFTGTVLMIKVNGNFVKNVIWKSGDGDLLDLAQ